MPLTSVLFKRNAKLQACAVEHPAHVTIGAVGEHVAKIQFALFSIDRLKIDRTELVAQRYGKSTAAAVLAYKKKRLIINRSYQQSVDNIVGKMTIASLDQEMLIRERVPNGGSDCRPGATGPALQSSASSIVGRGPRSQGAPASVPAGTSALGTKQLTGVARIVVLFASNAATDGFPLGKEIERARDSLAEHGLQLLVERSLGTAGEVKFVERVLVNPDAEGDNVSELRKRCEDLMPGRPDILRVIVCKLGFFDFGHTIRDRSVGGQVFKNFALLNTEQLDVSHATLIHEMVHCSKPRRGDPHDPEENSVFFFPGRVQQGFTERTTLRPEHALTIASSFFSLGGPKPPPLPKS